MRRIVWPLGAATLIAAACVSTRTAERRSIEFNKPRVSAGLIAPEGGEDVFALAVDRIERSARRAADNSVPVLRPTSSEAPPRQPASHQPEPASQRESSRTSDDVRFPSDAGRLVPLHKLSPTELDELVDAVALKLQADRGYAPASRTVAEMLPDAPPGVVGARVLVRSTDTGLKLIQLGYRSYLSQPASLWVFAVVLRDDGPVVNPDMELVEAAAAESLEAMTALRASLSPADLAAEVVQLSYVQADSALSALSGLGVNVVLGDKTIPETVEFKDLPLVSAMPTPAAESMALVGGDQDAIRDERGMFAIPTVAKKLVTETVSGRTGRLLVLFHPAHPRQHSRVLELLHKLVDVPARQVLIEGMIVEISEDGLKDLGIEWQFQEGTAQGVFGALNAGLAPETLSFMHDDAADLTGNWMAKLRALVRDNKAEILARPSVMTLDNRQATIRIGTDIPVATSQEGFGGGSNKISFDFRYLPTGILLNVRPRIDAKMRQISMQIDTTVSATVPGADLEVRDSTGSLLASAPTISSRRVQTYARIANNTPFIIGGLVSRETVSVTDKIPLVGDLPGIGRLFRAQRDQTNRREVIIVLTPYVLPDHPRIDPVIPKSEDMFDSFGHKLFRDAYRLREEEVFDLGFLASNARLQSHKRLANAAIRRDYRLADRAPFHQFAGDRIPGEHVLVERMIYDIAKRLKIAERVDAERIIYFDRDQHAGYHVRFLRDFMAGRGDGADMASFFSENPGRAIYLSFVESDDSPGGRDPVPLIGVVECASKGQWGDLLWQMNQPTPEGKRRSTILLHDEGDLRRLRRAIVVKRIVQLNGEEYGLSVSRFNVGTMLQMPDLLVDEIHLLDPVVARYFFHTEHYYAAATQQIEAAIAELDAALKTPRMRSLLDGTGTPGR